MLIFKGRYLGFPMFKFDGVKSQTACIGSRKVRTKFGGLLKRGGEVKKFVYI